MGVADWALHPKKSAPKAKSKKKSSTVSNALGSVVGNSGTATKPKQAPPVRPSATVTKALGSITGEQSSHQRVHTAVKAVRESTNNKGPFDWIDKAVAKNKPKGKRAYPLHYVDALPTKGKDGKLHYPKGSGPLIEPTTMTDIRRLLSPNRSTSERADALDRLQNRDKLPGDAILKELAKPPDKNAHYVGVKKKGGVEGFLRDHAGDIAKVAIPQVGAALGAGKGAQIAAPHLVDAAKQIQKTLAAANEATGGGRVGEQRSAGISELNVGKKVRKALQSGALATGSAVVEGLIRPVETVEAGLGKGALAAGLGDAQMRARLRKARGPVDVAVHGTRKSDIHGGDLAEAVGLPRQAGIIGDLALDPLMYGGLLLAPETGGSSLALTINRIRKVAPELMNTPEAVAAARAFNRTKDEAAFTKELKKLYRNQRKHLPDKSDDVKAIIEEGRRNRTTLVGKNGKPVRYSVPSRSGQAAVAQAIRSAESRAVKPTLRFQTMLPTGRTTLGKGAISIKGRNVLRYHPASLQGRQMPGVNLMPIGSAPIGRVKGAARERLVKQATTAARIDVAEETRQKTAAIDKLINDARLARDEERGTALKAQRQQIIDKQAARVEEEVAKRIGEIPKIRTVADKVREYNSAKAAHLGTLQASEFGRTVHSQFSKALEDATKVLDKEGKLGKRAATKTRSLKRVQLALYATEGQGGVGRHILEEAGIKLTPNEQHAAENFRKVYDDLLRHGQDLGIIEHGVRNYAGYRVWEKIDDPDELTQQVLRNVGNATTFDRHRSIAAVSDYASREELSKALVEAGATQKAADIAAEKLYRNGRVRAINEMTVRRLQRGDAVYWNDLTNEERRAIRFADNGHNESTTPLFRHPGNSDSTEGLVLPNATAWEEHGLPVTIDDAADTTEAAARRLYSAHIDQAQVGQWLEHALDDEFDDLHAIYSRLSDEVGTYASHGVDDSAVVARANELSALDDLHNGATEMLRGIDAQLEQAGYSQAHGATDYADRLLKERDDVEARVRELGEMRDYAAKQLGVSQQALRELTDVKLDAEGNAWLGGLKPGDQPPVEGIQPRSAFEPGPNDDPFDWTSRLPDGRSDAGALPNLDPRVSGYARARAQGVMANFQARWQAADQVYGRSVTEYADRHYIDMATGEERPLGELTPVFDENGRLTSFERDGEHLAADAVEFPGPTLIPNADRTIWLDPQENQVYMRPSSLKDLTGQLMIHNIPEDRVWPAQMIDDYKVAVAESQGTSRELYKTGMEKGVGRALSITRFGVTIPFPAYHIRNLFSDLLKSLQADTGVLFHPVMNYHLTKAAFQKGLGREISVPGLPKMTMEDFLFLADSVGIRTGHHAAEVMALARTGQFSDSELLRLHQKYNPFHVNGPITKFGAHREDMVRYMTFMQRLRHNGGDVADASWYTIRHHFNYNDLTQFEKTFVRNTFLFYTWYRKNLPLQLMELARRPGFFAGVESTYNATERGDTPLNFGPLSGPAPFQPALPDYVRDRNQAITTNWNGYAVNVAFGAPWSDLALASAKGPGELFSMLNPFLQGIGEGSYSVLTGRNGFDPLVGREYKNREPGGAVNAAAAAYKAVTGEELSKNENGDYVLPWWETYMLRSIPFLGRATFNLTGKKDTQPDTNLRKWSGLLSNVTGLSVFESPKPGSEEEKIAIGKIGTGIAGERRDLLERLSNEVQGGKKDQTYFNEQVKKFDKKAAEEAARRGIDLKDVKGSGKYVSPKKSGRKKKYGFGSSSGGRTFG